MPSLASAQPDTGGLPQLTRSASYNYIPALEGTGDLSCMRKTLSEVNLAHSSDQQTGIHNPDEVATGKEILRQASLRAKRNKPGATSAFTLGDDGEKGTSATTTAVEKPSKPPQESPARSKKTNAVTGAFVNFSRRPWRPSRSPSPVKSSKTPPSNEPLSLNQDAASTARTQKDTKRRPGDLVRTASFLTRRPKKQPAAPVPVEKTDPSPASSKASSIRSLRRKTSLEKLAASVGLSKKDAPPLPQPPPTNIKKQKSEQPRKRDELWNVFRSLDADYQKYHSKSSSLKVNVIRSSLLPCLSRYANHPSNTCLRPEDLDRRVNILNKWWTGLLETLSGRTSQSITGVDRPVYLEALTAIMMRPEWRVPIFPCSPGATPTQKSNFTQKSNTSLESTGSDFLVESIHHNIRNILSQNLLSQLAYCIDKMSTRHTPASLVSFAGKTCAYAFFFCRDVADMLTRLWSVTPDLIRRIVSQYPTTGSPASRGVVSEHIASYFPPAARSMSFTSHASLVRALRRAVSIPLAASNINWFGPWISRWCGRDTDLFFVFVKHFHILVAEFLPEGIDPSKRVYVPGLVSAHAQLLAILENTLNKQANAQALETLHTAASTTFEDLIDSAEATAAGFPFGATNSLRIMSENRLILILKNVLLDDTISADTRQFFLETFCAVLKLAARKTSLFDHGPCFVLCDFVEELVPIIPSYCQSTGQPDILDWDFWLDVCKQMMKSNNVMTEVRAFSFIFGIWDAVSQIDRRKEHLCLEVLLHKQYFFQYFSHWSPMVRAYFHRLICWRLGRLNDSPSALDRRIYCALSSRLGDVWSYFLSFQAAAEKRVTAPLSSVPCTPAPGRRLIIIRDDATPPPTGLFLYLDSVSHGQSNNPSPRTTIPSINASATAHATQPEPKKRWKSLKSIFGTSSNPKPGEVTPPGSSCDEGGGSEERVQDSKTHPDKDQARGSDADDSQKSYRTYTFRFCLEWMDRPRCIPRNRRLFPPSLPAQTQIFLQSSRNPGISGSDSGSGSGSLTNSLSETSSELESDTDYVEDVLSTPSPAMSPPAVTSAKEVPSAPVAAISYAANSCIGANKYAGRALAEWGMVVSECDCFFQRRRDEGIPRDGLVETPMLGVESFRK
ncbi:hypothetical protein LOZ65_000263 [Ophidiomyces ophidiicola]|nr:hypothetical protein LOZ65_000263 [Ophidiomyces ophidiicola]